MGRRSGGGRFPSTVNQCPIVVWGTRVVSGGAIDSAIDSAVVGGVADGMAAVVGSTGVDRGTRGVSGSAIDNAIGSARAGGVADGDGSRCR